MVVLFLPWHLATQLHPLDLRLFGVTKRLIKDSNSLSSLDFIGSATAQNIQKAVKLRESA
jgi:hypothetical protein